MDYRALLVLLWKTGRIDRCALEFTPGGDYVVENRGMAIEAAAADFSGTVIRNRSTGEVFKGGVRVDMSSSDWREEGTVEAPEFDNIILHLVVENDVGIIKGGQELLTCKVGLPMGVEDFCRGLGGMCKQAFLNYSSVEKEELLGGLIAQRVERKVAEAEPILCNSRENWHECHYQFFFRILGTPSKNKDAFLSFSRDFTFSRILNNSQKPEFLEAVAMGITGFLEVKNPDTYTQKLQIEFETIRKEKGITPTILVLNKYGFRQHSAIAISIIRGIYLLCANRDLFEDILKAETIKELYELFDKELPNQYWHTHSAPSVNLSGRAVKKFSKDRVDGIITNFVAPLLLVESIRQGDLELNKRALRFWDELPAERNRVVIQWSSKEWKPRNTTDTQALVHLHDVYCKTAKCVKCPLGSRLVYRYLCGC